MKQLNANEEDQKSPKYDNGKERVVANIQEMKFCNELIAHGNRNIALKKAGFNVKDKSRYAYMLLKKPYIQQYLKERRKDIENEFSVEFEVIVRKLGKLVHLAVPLDATELSQTDPRTGIAAIAELNRMLGYYAPEKHANVNINIDNDASIVKVDETLRSFKEHKSEY